MLTEQINEDLNRSVKARKLKVIWPVDVKADMQTFYDIDVQKELVNIVSKEIQEEIDKEMLNGIKKSSEYLYR